MKTSRCTEDNCNQGGPYVLGLCNMHYRRLRRHGSTTVTRKPPRGLDPDATLRWRGWDVTETGCWELRGAPDKDGYRGIGFGGINHKAHRFAYETWVGPIPAEHMILHSCDNPPCVNPEHLRTGTNQDNVEDMWTRGRAGNVRLTVDQVREMRSLRETTKMTIQQLADQFQVTHACAVAVIYRRSWKNV